MTALPLFIIIAAAFASGALHPAPEALAALPLFFGPVIDRTTLTDAMRGFKTIFTKAYDEGRSYADSLAMRVESVTRQEEYRWLGALPGLREWLGERAVKDLAQDGFVIKNRDFEATVAVSRNDIEDDNLSLYKPLFAQLGELARQHPDQMLFELLAGGFTTACHDGQFFFDTGHPSGAQAAWGNKSTDALSAASYETARHAMMSLVNDEGRPMRLMPSSLIVPPQLEKTALDILRADRSANGASNVWANSADIIVAPELAANPTYWFLADLRRAVKPFILQMRQAPRFTAMDNPEDENVFMRKEYLYGVDYRGAAGYGLPALIHGSTGGA